MSGNVVPNATPIYKQDYQTALLTIQSILPNGIPIYPFGSAGKKQLSGDIDIFIDINDLQKVFPSSTDKELRTKLATYLTDESLFSARTGISVHVGIIVNGNVIQVDLMTVHYAADIQELHDHDYSDDTMSGKTVVSMWCDLANLANPEFMISPYKGLCYRSSKELITRDKSEIAKLILSPTATADDLRSPKKILSAISHNPHKFNTLKDRYFL